MTVPTLYFSRSLSHKAIAESLSPTLGGSGRVKVACGGGGGGGGGFE